MLEELVGNAIFLMVYVPQVGMACRQSVKGRIRQTSAKLYLVAAKSFRSLKYCIDYGTYFTKF